MSRTITVPDELYARLEEAALTRGLRTVEELLEQLQISAADLTQRKQAVSEIEHLRNRLFAKYGEMSDSTELVRQDRIR
jgi:hypothetical protein